MLKAEIPDLLTRIIHGWVHAKAGTVHYIMSRFWKAKLFNRPFTFKRPLTFKIPFTFKRPFTFRRPLTFKRPFTFKRPLKQTDFTEEGFGLNFQLRMFLKLLQW